MRKFGLIGFPIKHSYSAIMHNAAFKSLGIDAEYELFEIEPKNLKEKFSGLVNEGLSGLNVTIPHKETTMKLLNEVDEESKLIGAVNTVKIMDDKTTKGFNTDGLGFITHLKDVIGFDPKGKQTSMLGAGGAAKAVSIQLAKSGAKNILLFDIDQNKTEALASNLKKNFPKCDVKVVSSADALLHDKPDFLVNATPIGMHPDDGLVFDSVNFHRKLVVYDLVYNPTQTPLLREAKAKGCAGVFNGLGMLLYQGALAFKVWLEADPPVEIMEEALRGILNKG